MIKNQISKATLGRIPKYLEFLKASSTEHISSAAIAKALTLGEVQVRKDLNAICGMGKPKIGYLRKDLLDCMIECIGSDDLTYAVLVGAGKLGQALFDYRGFDEFGVKIISIFDNNEEIIKSNNRILPMSAFSQNCRDHGVKIGIIAVNKESAQGVCDLMVKNNIKAIWNFAPCKLNVPDDVVFLQENLALSLAHLKNKIG